MGLHIVQTRSQATRGQDRRGYQFIADGIDAVFLYRQPLISVNNLAITSQENLGN